MAFSAGCFGAWNGTEGVASTLQVNKNGSLEMPFIYINDHFTKTGSGQT